MIPVFVISFRKSYFEDQNYGMDTFCLPTFKNVSRECSYFKQFVHLSLLQYSISCFITFNACSNYFKYYCLLVKTFFQMAIFSTLNQQSY